MSERLGTYLEAVECAWSANPMGDQAYAHLPVAQRFWSGGELHFAPGLSVTADQPDALITDACEAFDLPIIAADDPIYGAVCGFAQSLIERDRASLSEQWEEGMLNNNEEKS
jgi:hypothetical protein